MTVPAYLKNHLFLSTVIFLILLGAVVLLVAVPALAEIRLIETQIYDERARLEKLYVRGQLQKKVRVSYNRIAPEAKFLEEIFLPTGQELTYITALEEAASRTGSVLQITAGETRPLAELNFNFTLTGAWPSILRWLDAVERLPHYTNIKEISVAGREDRDGRPVTTASIVADTYWLVN